MNGPEAQTCQEIIDGKLSLAGWNVNDPSQVVQELDIYVRENTGEILTGDRAGAGTTGDFVPNPFAGHRFADYALMMDGKPVAVVEAKKSSADARTGSGAGLALR